MLNLFALFNLGAAELIVLGFIGFIFLAAIAVVGVVVFLITRDNKKGPGNE
jgi:hypothetical protein